MFLEEYNLKNKSGPLIRLAYEAALINLGIEDIALFGADYKHFYMLLLLLWIKFL